MTDELPAEEVETKDRLQETEQGKVTDPAEEFDVPAEVPENHDDVDVALHVGKETQDGKGADPVPEADFVSYEDPAADKQESS